MKKLDALNNPTTKSSGERHTMRDGNFVGTGEVNPLPIEIPKEEESIDFIKLHNIAVMLDEGDCKIFTQVISSRYGKLWKLSMIAEPNNFDFLQAWMAKKFSELHKKKRKPIPVTCAFTTKLEPDGSERLKS